VHFHHKSHYVYDVKEEIYLFTCVTEQASQITFAEEMSYQLRLKNAILIVTREYEGLKK
jgi:hypothetical protein